MKTYYLNFTRGTAERKVVVRDDESGATAPLRHHRSHSYDDRAPFNWGYGGSGPSELARCLLLDHLGYNDELERLEKLNADTGFELPESHTSLDADRLVPPVLYQQFKADVIAQLEMGASHVLSSREIDEWLNTKGVWHRERTPNAS